MQQQINETSCTSSRSSWQAQLLQVSAELSERLQDPHFVATRCNLDGSGDLNLRELQLAARVLGIDGHQLQQLRAERQISKERFAAMVADFHGEGKRTVATVPHCLRGMALGQLQHLDSLFVQTGWLQAQCNSFNKDNANAILRGERFEQRPNLYALDTFVVTPTTKPGNCAARDQDGLQWIPAATGTSSFSELVNPYGLYVHCFVSHYWGHDFSSTVKALALWADAKMTEQPQCLVFWICLFALNQHIAAEEVGGNPREGPFNAALAQASCGAVMVVDEQISPFGRIWCLFEISRLKDLQRPFELISAMGSLCRPETFQQQAAAAEMMQNAAEALWTVSATSAESSMAADKYQIWSEIADKCWRCEIDAQGAESFFIQGMRKGILHKYFLDFDYYVRSLLSTSVLGLLLARSEYALAAKCCIHGAGFDKEQLAEICSSFTRKTQRKAWLNQLLTTASDASMSQLLFEHSADADAANDYGSTALILAAGAGKEAVAKVLLEHRADVGKANQHNRTALMAASFCGHPALVKLLLEHDADVRAVDHLGRTALLAAAFGGHGTVVKLLLEHGTHGTCNQTVVHRFGFNLSTLGSASKPLGADVKALSAALISAAEAGHEAVAKLLLEHAADVHVKDGHGRTALMLTRASAQRMRSEGHKAVAKLLLEHGAG
eukprot:Skav214954  [mRNA]  locus=scaffold2320:150250:152808:+ [translate_table: standard]